ncbi:MAG: DUF1292 domain-containing protein [Solobacterium sp.]|nr:DUF1292 domain-containing protein [Solobacterium sp.]
MSENMITLISDDGQETQAELILTFEYEGKNIALIGDGDDVYPFFYDDDGNMNAVEDPELLEVCAEVLNAFEEEAEENE